MKALFGILLLSILGSNSFAADPMPPRLLKVASAAINQYVLVAANLGGAFPPNLPPEKVQICVTAGTAIVGFETLRAFNYSDAEISVLLSPTKTSPTQIQADAVKAAHDCGNLL